MSHQHDQNELKNEYQWSNTHHSYGFSTSEKDYELVMTLNNNVEKTTQSSENKQRAFETTIETLAVNFCLLKKKAKKDAINETKNAVRQEDFRKEIFSDRIRNYGY